jgi:transglutaminase-like putative cysteine protease
MSNRLLVCLCAIILASVASSAPAAEPVKYKLEYKPERKFEVIEKGTYKPNGCEVKEFVYYLVAPPATPRQEVTLKAEPDGQEGFTEGADKRPLVYIRQIFAKPVADAELKYTVTISGTANEVFLTPLKDGETPPAVAALSAQERERYTAKTDVCDFDSAEVKEWLDKEGLRRKKDETDLDFAQRVYLSMRTTFTYKDDAGHYRANHKASQVVHDRIAVCTGLSHTFAAALRASGVPTRCLILTPIRVNGDLDALAMSTMTHMNNEFYAEGIGWAPVDMSTCVNAKGEAEALEDFGHHHAKFYISGIEDDAKLAPKLSIDTVTFGGTEKGPAADFRSSFPAGIAKLHTTPVWVGWTGSRGAGGVDHEKQFVVHTDPLAPERVDPAGEPKLGQQPVSFRIWRDDAGWHVRTHNGDKKEHKFSIVVSAETGAIAQYTLLSDGKSHEQTPRITMDFTTADDNGVDFRPAANTPTLRFDLVQDGKQPLNIYIGKSRFGPTQIPFLLATAPTP